MPCPPLASACESAGQVRFQQLVFCPFTSLSVRENHFGSAIHPVGHDRFCCFAIGVGQYRIINRKSPPKQERPALVRISGKQPRSTPDLTYEAQLMSPEVAAKIRQAKCNERGQDCIETSRSSETK